MALDLSETLVYAEYRDPMNGKPWTVDLSRTWEMVSLTAL